VVVLRGPSVSTADTVEPVAVFEVLSASTALTDLRVKPEEYASVPSIAVYAILAQDGGGENAVFRRSRQWAQEEVADRLELPEIGVSIDMRELRPAG
jgi:Uma2 family endonuclease